MPDKLQPANPLVSVILPVRNESRGIRDAVGALRQQTWPADRLEILVIDGRSDDDTAAVVLELAAADPRIRLIDNPARITPVALNAGLHAARGDVIVRMDGHARAEPDYIETAVRLLEETGAWSVGGVMHKVGSNPAEQANAIAGASPLGVGDASHNYATHPRWAESVFLGVWPRWVFDRVGQFDEELVRNQDDEHAFRIRQAGGRIRFDPSLVVHYTPRSGLRAIFDQYRQYGYWKVRVFQKHPGAGRPRHYIPPAFVAALVLGTASTPWSRVGRLLLTSTIGSYALVLVGGTAFMTTPGTTRPRVAAAIAAMHLGYGIGFWQGVWAFRLRRQHPTATGPERPTGSEG